MLFNALKILFYSYAFLCFNTYASELQIITPEIFIAKYPSSERKSIIEFITNQFDGKSVSQSQLDNLWNDEEAREALNLARFQIIDQKLYTSAIDETHPYFRAYVQHFQKLLNKYKINDVDFIVHAIDQLKMPGEDDSHVKKLQQVPTFMMFKNLSDPYESTRFLLPEALILWDSWPNILKKIDTASNANKWQDKINKIYWRGSTTGPESLPYNIENFNKLPRLSLAILSKLYPNLIDAGFSYYSSHGDIEKILDILFDGVLDKVSEESHITYKYLISLDGNSCSGTRVPWIMYSNSVLIKQETNKIEWFYPALKPYIHYVPVNERLTDIFKQIEWMRNHDKELQIITSNGHNFVAKELMPENIEAHMVITLNKYHEIQKDKKLIASLPTVEETRSAIRISVAVIKKIKRNFMKWIWELWHN